MFCRDKEKQRKPLISGFLFDSVEITGLEPATFRLRT